MKIKTYTIEEKTLLPQSLLEIFNLDQYCVTDIETTGLSRQYHQVILIGILYNVNDRIVLKQFFAEKPNEETRILNEFSKVLKNFSYVVTYNGATFDIPFLKERFKHNRLEWTFDHIKHIDILQYVKKQKKCLGLENLRLKTVEKLIGIHRRDTISGEDSVLLYKQYVNNPSSSIENTILLHNYEDVYYLNKLLHIFDRISIHPDELIGKDIIIQHDVGEICFNFYPKDMTIKRASLHIKGTSPIFKNMLDIVYYGSNFNFYWYAQEGSFLFQLSLAEGYLSTGEKCSYVDLSDLNLRKSQFADSSFFDDKYFPNNLMIIKYKDEVNIHLIGKLLSLILESIFKNR